MALHQKTAKSRKQSAAHYTKPSRLARHEKREKARQKILKDGEWARDHIELAKKDLQEMKDEITAAHAEGTWSPEAQQSAEERLARQYDLVHAYTTNIALAKELSEKLASYKL